MTEAELRPPTADITTLLRAWQHGDTHAREQLVRLIEADLRRLARNRLRHEQHGITLQTGDLVNEAWLRLDKAQQLEWPSRSHFYRFVAEQMRRVIVDVARARSAVKRGAGERPVTFSEVSIQTPEQRLSVEELLALDEALTKLAHEDARGCRVVELRFFYGLTFEEIAELEQVTTRTLKDDWSFAKARLRQLLEHDAPPGGTR